MVIILGLVAGNVYFINESRKPPYPMMIGRLVRVDRIDFGDVIKSKEDVHDITFALIDARSIEKPEVSNNLPDATLWINDWHIGVTWRIVDVWFDGDEVIFGSRDKNYKTIIGNQGERIKEIIFKYQPITN